MVIIIFEKRLVDRFTEKIMETKLNIKKKCMYQLYVPSAVVDADVL